MPTETETIHLKLTPDEAVKLFYICNKAYLDYESILNIAKDSSVWKGTKKSMSLIQSVKEKIKTACLHRGEA